MALIWTPSTSKDFSDHSTAGFTAHGHAVTAADGVMRVGNSGEDLVEKWTGGGNLPDPFRISCSVIIDTSVSSGDRRCGVIGPYANFNAGLLCGTDGAGRLVLMTDPYGGSMIDYADMTGGGPAHGDKVFFRLTRDGDDLILEEFRENPLNPGAEANTSFLHTLAGADASSYGTGIVAYPMGMIQLDTSPNGGVDDLLIEAGIEDRRLAARRDGFGRRSTDTGEGGAAVPMTGRIWPR